MQYKVPDKKYELVQQRESFDCVVASLTMLLGEDYEVIYGMLKTLGWRDDLKIGVSDRLIFKLLKEFGEKPVRSFHIHPVPSLLVVPSLNRRYGLHCVFYDGDERILDPLNGVSQFKNFYLEDFEIGRVTCKSITLERFFVSGLDFTNGHTVPMGGYEEPKDREAEGILKRLVKNMHHWDDRGEPINQQFKWQIEEAEKILESRGIYVREEDDGIKGFRKNIRSKSGESGTISI